VIPLSPGVYLRLAAAGAILAGLAWSHWAAYDLGGKDMEREKAQAMLQAALDRAEALERLADANGRMLAIETDAAARIAAAQRSGAARVQTVERVIRENPDFAAVVRPADLERVRDDALADIAAAADRSADLSAESLRGVRAAGDGDGPHAR
jgi:hypothetical protein